MKKKEMLGLNKQQGVERREKKQPKYEKSIRKI